MTFLFHIFPSKFSKFHFQPSILKNPDFPNTPFKLSFAFLPLSSHFAMEKKKNKEEKREKGATERSSSVFLKTLEISTRYVVLIYYMQLSSEIFVLILP